MVGEHLPTGPVLAFEISEILPGAKGIGYFAKADRSSLSWKDA
jgi:hypothetical protein